MKSTRKFASLTSLVLTVGAAACFLPATHAETMTFSGASAGSAAAAMNQRYGVTIVFRGNVNTNQPVTFSVDNPNTPDGRLQAISSLASALGLDFQKVFVVSKIAPGTTVPRVRIDSNGPIVFGSTRISARSAITTVANVDNAIAQISGSVEGDVILPGTRMNAADAAAVIAKQTGTQWKAYYGMFRRGDEPPRLAGTVIDRTNGGQPIMELPLLSFRSSTPTVVPLSNSDNQVIGPLDPFSSNPAVASVPNTNFGIAPDNGLTGFGYGDPYGYTNPYGPYGYVMPNGTVATPGTVVTPGAGTAPAVPGVNAPGLNTAPVVGGY